MVVSLYLVPMLAFLISLLPRFDLSLSLCAPVFLPTVCEALPNKQLKILESAVDMLCLPALPKICIYPASVAIACYENQQGKEVPSRMAFRGKLLHRQFK